ncbi:MAG: efflux RND transporter periplasmic adaptor subunit [Pseudomonadota bacterium]
MAAFHKTLILKTAIVAFAIGSIVFARSIFQARSAVPSLAASASPVVVPTLTVRYISMPEARSSYTGRIVPGNVVDLSFDLGGEIVTVDVEAGDTVMKSDVIATLSTRSLEQRSLQAESSIRQARARLSLAESDLARLEGLVPLAATEQQVETARTDVDVAQAELQQAQATLDAVLVDISKTRLQAPFSSEVISKDVETGASVTAGQRIVRLNRDSGFKARIGVPPDLAASMETGEIVTLTAGTKRGLGRMLRVFDDVDLATQTLTVEFEIIDNPGFVASELVVAEFDSASMGEAQGFWLPITALQQSYQGLWSVYTLVDDHGDPVGQNGSVIGKLSRSVVEVLRIETEKAFVRGALDNGSLFVSDATFRIVPGQEVRSVPDQHMTKTIRSKMTD